MKQKHVILSILIAFTTMGVCAQVMNRPIGQYPGNPNEYYGPTLVQDSAYGYRNLALFRTVYQSS